MTDRNAQIEIDAAGQVVAWRDNWDTSMGRGH